MRKYLLVAVSAMIISFPAAAQWAVIDAANLQQSIMNTLSTLEQEISSAESLANQYRQLDYEYRQLKSLADGDMSGMFGVVDGARTVQQLYARSIKGLYGDVSNAKSVADSLYNRMASSGLSPEEWVLRETEVNQSTKEGVGYLSDYQASVFKQVENRYQEVKNLQSQIAGTEGMHQSMQLLNTQMNALLTTTNQIVEQNAVMAQYIARKEAIDVGKDQNTTDTYETWLSAQKTNRENTRKLFDKIGK